MAEPSGGSKFDIPGAVAIVTGGAGGIGSCIARAYASAGACVVLASRDAEALERVASEITSGGGEALAIQADITVPADVEEMVSRTVETFGRLDVLVNNAGGGARPKKAEDTPYDEWQRVVDLNLTGTFLCCMAAGKQMIEQNSGNIINISSVAGTKGNPGMLHYSAAKAGVISLSNNLAFMWAKHDIRVNCVAPGLIATPAMKSYPGVIEPAEREDGTPVPRLERPPEPEDVADLCLFLASPASSLITGELIPIRSWTRLDRFWN